MSLIKEPFKPFYTSIKDGIGDMSRVASPNYLPSKYFCGKLYSMYIKCEVNLGS